MGGCRTGKIGVAGFDHYLPKGELHFVPESGRLAKPSLARMTLATMRRHTPNCNEAICLYLIASA